jgi:hypothetical protein
VSAPPLTTIKPNLPAWASIYAAIVLQALDPDEQEPPGVQLADDGLTVIPRAST